MALTYSHTSQCPGSQTTIFVCLKPWKTPSSRTNGDKNTIKWVNRTVAFYLTVPGTWSSPDGTHLLPTPRPPARQAKTWILPTIHPSMCRFTLLEFFSTDMSKEKNYKMIPRSVPLDHKRFVIRGWRPPTRDLSQEGIWTGNRHGTNQTPREERKMCDVFKNTFHWHTTAQAAAPWGFFIRISVWTT